MNRKELVDAVHAGIDGLRGRAAATTAVDVIIKTISAALVAGENVEINSFGKFVHVDGRRYTSVGILKQERLSRYRRGHVWYSDPQESCGRRCDASEGMLKLPIFLCDRF